MNTYISMGIFGFFVALVSLLRLLARDDFFRVRSLKRIFGRKLGLALYFIANVALPLVAGLLFFCTGLSAKTAVPSLVGDTPLLVPGESQQPENDVLTHVGDFSLLS